VDVGGSSAVVTFDKKIGGDVISAPLASSEEPEQDEDETVTAPMGSAAYVLSGDEKEKKSGKEMVSESSDVERELEKKKKHRKRKMKLDEKKKLAKKRRLE
jgi:hypothetical protein